MPDKDPTKPSDLLDRPLAEGDLVVWPTSAGRAVGISVGVIVKINFKAKKPGGYSYVDCPQHMAEKYTVGIRPLAAGAKYHYTPDREYVPDGFMVDGKRKYFRETGKGVKPITVQKVQNLVKLETPDRPVQDAYA